MIPLYDCQKDHVARLCDILEDQPAAFDFSPPGTGKTITSLWVANWYSQKHHFKQSRAVVVSLVPIIDSNWVPTTEYISFESIASIGYEKLRGTYSTGCHNFFLNRHGDEYEVTAEFQQLIDEGILLIVDEYQKLKNAKTAQARSLFAIMRAIVGTKSRALFLSATPYYNKRETESTIRLAGIVTATHLIEYLPKLGKYRQEGINELRNYCNEIDRRLTAKLCPAIVTDKNYEDVIYDLFLKIIKPVLVSAMDAPPIKVNITSINLLIDLPEHEDRQLIEAYEVLRKKIAVCKANNNLNGVYEAINTCSSIAERSKLGGTIEQLRKKAEEDPNGKILLYVWLKESIEKAYEKLSEYFPGQVATLNGDTPKGDRPKIISKYMEDNNNLRIIIAHPSVGGVGISLDDRTGRHRRYLFGMPTHRIIEEIQYIARIYRITTTTDAEVTFILSKGVKSELQLIESACEKLGILSELTDPKYLQLIFPKQLVQG